MNQNQKSPLPAFLKDHLPALQRRNPPVTSEALRQLVDAEQQREEQGELVVPYCGTYEEFRAELLEEFPYLQEDTLRAMYACEVEGLIVPDELIDKEWLDYYLSDLSPEEEDYLKQTEPLVWEKCRSLSRDTFAEWFLAYERAQREEEKGAPGHDDP